jgi:hypothetical protein
MYVLFRAAALQQLVDNDLMYQNNRQRFDPYVRTASNYTFGY